MRILEPEGHRQQLLSRGFFKQKQMLVGVPYLALGVCVMVAAWLVMNWLI